MAPYIIYADDKLLDRKIYQKRLENAGYEVLAVASGQEVILAALKRKPQLIILDDRLGSVTGVEVCKQLHDNVNTESIPIMIFTAYTSSQRETEATDAQADEYLDKGADRELFLSKVKNLLARKAPHVNYCILTITIDDTIQFDLTGLVNEQGTKQPFENKVRNRFNQEMQLASTSLYHAHNSWRKNKNDGSYLKKRREWRPHALNRGKDMYEVLFRQNMTLAESWGRAQQSVNKSHQDLMLRFSGPRENLALPLELLHNENGPLAIRHPMSRQVTGRGNQSPSWRKFIERSQNQNVNVLLVASEKLFISESDMVAQQLAVLATEIGAHLQIDRGVTHNQLKELKKLNKIYHIIHFAGHASFDIEHPENSAIHFSDGDMRTSQLYSWLENSPPQFLFLSCCSGAEIGLTTTLDSNTNLGIIDAALRAGVPNVLGYRWPVVSRSAKDFAEAFYQGLIDNPNSLEYAVYSARRRIFDESSEGGWDETWFSPILVIQNPGLPDE